MSTFIYLLSNNLLLLFSYLGRLTVEEALSKMPPKMTYNTTFDKSRTTTKTDGIPPTKVALWDDVFGDLDRYRKTFDQQRVHQEPNFEPYKDIRNEEGVRAGLELNVLMALNKILSPYFFTF